jgi:HK97 gp10 family phage protein
MAFNIKIEGELDIQKAFESKEEAVKNMIIRDLDEGADMVIASAKDRVHRVTGHLQDSIDKNEVVDKNGIIDVYVGIAKNEWFSKEDKYYPRFVEKGTSKMRARPYLRPALNENKKQIQSKIESDLKGIIGQ